LVIAVGGDGTVRAVATRLVGRSVPITVIPAGTANNIAVALGVYGRAPHEIIAGLARPIRRFLDIGAARGSWGQQYFVESAGCGLFADLLFSYSQEDGRSLLRALATLVQVLPGYRGAPARVTVDGREFSGTFLLVEAMNSPYVAMRVPLAPEADIGDGEFDVVLVEDDARAGLLASLSSAVRGGVTELPNATVVRGRQVRISWEGSAAHVDDALCLPPPQSPADDAWLELEVLASAQEVWVPTLAPGP
jgi:diacylglycerol kinase family enzyme